MKRAHDGADDLIPQLLDHATRADLKLGDLFASGYSSNYGKRKQASLVYLTSTPGCGHLGCRAGRRRRPGPNYIVEPAGLIADTPI